MINRNDAKAFQCGLVSIESQVRGVRIGLKALDHMMKPHVDEDPDTVGGHLRAAHETAQGCAQALEASLAMLHSAASTYAAGADIEGGAEAFSGGGPKEIPDDD